MRSNYYHSQKPMVLVLKDMFDGFRVDENLEKIVYCSVKSRVLR